VVNVFFDTSAVVPLIFREPRSAQARQAWNESSLRIGWQWLRVETEAALCRRKGNAAAWSLWRKIETGIHWVEPDGEWWEHLKVFNRGVGLRAADAGHLYVMERCAASVADLVLVTFDGEMANVAKKRGVGLFPY